MQVKINLEGIVATFATDAHSWTLGTGDDTDVYGLKAPAEEEGLKTLAAAVQAGESGKFPISPEDVVEINHGMEIEDARFFQLAVTGTVRRSFAMRRIEPVGLVC